VKSYPQPFSGELNLPWKQKRREIKLDIYNLRVN
jgi:hypothetical protein